jgi:hypothetical protein
MVRQGKSLRRVLRERTGDRTSGGTGTGEGPSAPDGGSGDRPTQGEAAQPRRFTLANIKSYRITGPLALAVGIARDPAAAEPDVTAEFAFTRGKWKVVGIVPRF